MIEIEKDGLICLQFPHFLQFEDLRHGIFTRQGGYSRKPFHDLNVSLSVGDSPGRVTRNRSRIAAFMGIQQRQRPYINAFIIIRQFKSGKHSADKA